MAKISKEALKQSIVDNVKVLYKKTIDEATTELSGGVLCS